MSFKPSTLTDTIDAIGKVAADAARTADALDHHMRREQRDPVLHGVLHRLLGACQELERHTTAAIAGM
jgi:hypothetical protein